MSASTIQDVAKASGVSVATVSRVLNNSATVAEATREMVLNTIKQLDYQPNLLGRNLRRTETRLILALLPTIANPFYSRIVKGIEDVAHKNGYNVMLCNTDSTKEREQLYLGLLKNRLADGVILMAPRIEGEELTAISADFPVVQCCEYKEGAKVSLVRIDNYAAARKAAKHLISLGHKKIGIISSHSDFLSILRREEGFRSVLEEAGLPLEDQYLAYGDYSFKSGHRSALALLALKEQPTAIFAISDVMAIGALRALREKGLKVPDDVAVVGFDNISFSSMCDPMLTTVSQPKYDLGCTAMDLLLKTIQGELKEPLEIVLENELVIRESTIRS
jgi:LacI family transcriptional regulator, repressor for deo operon, udp, cdd, tsx, nupC, and nupG